jgi:hypothetical protein
MLEALFWFGVGLIVGWNLLPQPQWIKNLFIKAKQNIFGI